MSKRDWLKGKSWHRIRNEMLDSPAWKAASHLQRSMILALLTELGRHSGKDNGHLIFTNRNLQEFGFSFNAIKRNMIAIEALGFIAHKRGHPGLKGYGQARRVGFTFLPTLDADGNEIKAPTDEWRRFNTTEEAKAAVKAALKRAKVTNSDTKMRSLASDTKKGSLRPDSHPWVVPENPRKH